MVVEIPLLGAFPDYLVWLFTALIFVAVLFILVFLKVRSLPKVTKLPEIGGKGPFQMGGNPTDETSRLRQRNLELEDKITGLNEKVAEITERLMKAENERTEIKRLVAETGKEAVHYEIGRASELEEELDEMEKKLDAMKTKQDEYFHQTELFKLLLSRYKDVIADKESKTVQDIKAMVQPRNQRVEDMADDIKKKFPKYDPRQNILRAAEIAYNRISGEIHSVPSPGIDFWLSISEILENKVSDYEDKAILLCSIFKALDGEASVLITELTDGSNRPLVLLRTGRNYLLCDPNRKHDFKKYIGPRDGIIDDYTIDGNRVARLLFEFNDRDYKNYQE